jgi:hypothetical protein
VEHSIKTEHKKGMLDFIKTHMEGTFVLTGEHNDTFVALGNKLSGAKRWIHQTVAEHGPILLSMIGRLYREQTKQDFKEVSQLRAPSNKSFHTHTQSILLAQSRETHRDSENIRLRGVFN